MYSDKPGTIVVPTQEIGRFTMFMVSMSTTRQPDGSNLSIRASVSVTENINSSIRDDLREEDAWVWIMGDDHVWPNNTLMTMLEILDTEEDIDILLPLVLKRNPPWFPVIFHATDLVQDGVPAWQPFEWEEIPRHGTFEIDAAGSAGMLIKREVIDAMDDPWFESSNGVILNEDVNFCVKARELGFRIFATADVTLGHLGIFNVRPFHNGERWGALTEFTSPEEQFRNMFMPTGEVEPVSRA